ncbi:MULTISPECIES: HAAS signaling domain-containing protein [Catenuloplanes]|uniref:Uncharacterized protein n=1 Tax=Catenuloplanes niger TaxID=587534 RepID=A0AAE4CTW0_9ACTN|nr:hypothetical protein [Catenuloplanes niger]MDR7322723.1 hypothetical protein [Catenuloplanes niger]
MSVTEDLEITHYVEAVRAALSDLPSRQRDDLLEDLPSHLAEVRAESGEPLSRRLGPPEVYAAELRVAMGMVGGGRVPLRARLDEAAHRLRARGVDVDRRAGTLLGYEQGSDFLRQLRPAWWVLRGYLVAMFVAVLVSNDAPGVLPRVDGSLLMALFLLGSFVLGSIWLGRREAAGLPRNPRLMLRGVAGMLALWAFVLLWQVDSRSAVDQMVDSYGTSYAPAVGVEDVYVYDRNGRLLTDVRLFDQNGQPIELGWSRCAAEPPLSGQAVYPHCPELAPFQVPSFPAPSESIPGAPSESVPGVPSDPDAVPSPEGVVPPGPGAVPSGSAGAEQLERTPAEPSPSAR